MRKVAGRAQMPAWSRASTTVFWKFVVALTLPNTLKRITRSGWTRTDDESRQAIRSEKTLRSVFGGSPVARRHFRFKFLAAVQGLPKRRSLHAVPAQRAAARKKFGVRLSR